MVVVAPGLTVAGEPLAEEVKTGVAAPAGTTKRVMLCAGSEVEKLLPVQVRSLRWLIAFDDVSCQRSARPAFEKLARLTVSGVLPERYFESTMMVSAPPDVRCAAKAATLSGLGPVAEMLVSPNVDLLPS